MARGRRWTSEEINQIRELAAQPGQYASVIGVHFGVSLLSILTICGRHNISVVRYTPDEQAHSDKLKKARNRRKHERWQAKQLPAPHMRRIAVHLGTSRTHPIYRNQLPKLADNTSKEALRRMISEAVRNTAEMAT